MRISSIIDRVTSSSFAPELVTTPSTTGALDETFQPEYNWGQKPWLWLSKYVKVNALINLGVKAMETTRLTAPLGSEFLG